MNRHFIHGFLDKTCGSFRQHFLLHLRPEMVSVELKRLAPKLDASPSDIDRNISASS